MIDTQPSISERITKIREKGAEDFLRIFEKYRTTETGRGREEDDMSDGEV